MLKASDLKKGHVVEMEGSIYLVKQVDVKSPSSRGGTTLYKTRFSELQTGLKRDETFTGDDVLTEVDLARRAGQYLYRENDALTFMDQEDYNQFTLNIEDVGEEAEYLYDGIEGLQLLLVDGEIVGIQLPSSVVMEVIDTVPALKGGTAAARTKPAKLATGLVVQVPEYVATGDIVKVNTETGKFMSRA